MDGYGETGTTNARAEFDMTGMAFGDTRDDREPQSGAIDPGPIEPVETPAQLGQPLRRDPGAVIGHAETDAAALRHGAGSNPNLDMPATRRVMQGIVEQIADHDAQRLGFTDHGSRPAIE